MKLCPKCHKQFSDDANFCPVDAARLAPLESQSVAADTISAKFDLGDRLGGARTGAVHRATDKATGQVAALKVIAPAVVALPGLAQRLERELKQLERVQSAGVAKVLASGKRGDDPWLALELLDGAQTLAEAIAARGPIPLEQAANLIEVVGEALIEAAQVGVVHRDLAPKNVLFAGDEIKLINFSLPVPGDKVPGVAEFVAPEQHDGKPVDQRSNLYSLGALYYFVLTGHAVQHEDGVVRPPSALADVPPGVDAVIVRALDKSPTKRFLTVRQFVDEVSRVARGEADQRSTQAMGRAGKPKAELVQTLLGVRGGFGASVAPVPSPPSSAVAVVASTVSAGVPAPTTAAGVAVSPMIAASQAPVAGAISGPGQPTLLGPAMPAPLQPQAIAPERSPWAPPSTIGPQSDASMEPEGRGEAPSELPVIAPVAMEAPAMPAPIVAPVVVAPPVVAAPVLAAPVLPKPAAPVVPAPLIAAAVVGAGASGSGKKAKAEKGDKSKGKFRETMWFKKGELDVQAAEAAAAEHAATGKEGSDKADQLPIDERYKDDGTLSRSDKEKYSLRTGATQMNMVIRDSGTHNSLGKVSEDALIDEMKGGRNKIFALIAVGLVVVVLIIVMLVR